MHIRDVVEKSMECEIFFPESGLEQKYGGYVIVEASWCTLISWKVNCTLVSLQLKIR